MTALTPEQQTRLAHSVAVYGRCLGDIQTTEGRRCAVGHLAYALELDVDHSAYSDISTALGWPFGTGVDYPHGDPVVDLYAWNDQYSHSLDDDVYVKEIIAFVDRQGRDD